MALAFYKDAAGTAFVADPMRTLHDGHLGGSYDQLVYVRNNAIGMYYTSLSLQVVTTGVVDYSWQVKFNRGSRRPTEAEWDLVGAGDTLYLDDIGTTLLGSTAYTPVWVRIYCPGLQAAQIRETFTLRCYNYERVVGT